MADRLQKVMAHAGLGSRRACEALILAGRVTVNGQRPVLGATVDPARDEIRVDGERLPAEVSPVYVALNKPVGVVSTLRSQDGRPTVRDLVALPGRLYPVGRLDADSEGLVLLSNDGELALRLTHPRFGHEKEYRVLLDRAPDDGQLEAWRRGVVLEGAVRTQPVQVRLHPAGDKAWVRIVMREGRKRQIRETAEALGLHVRRLVRVRLGQLRLGNLKPGEWRQLDANEVRLLLDTGPARAHERASGSHARRVAAAVNGRRKRSKEAGWQR